MNISEAGAAQILLRSAAGRVYQLVAAGLTDTQDIVLNVNDVDLDLEPRAVELGHVIKAGELLADRSNKALGAGWDARLWREAIGRGERS